MLAPREHDVLAGLCGPDPARFLRAYGAERLDLTHLEYARLARSLRDLAARISKRGRPGGRQHMGLRRVAPSGHRPRTRPTILDR